MSWLGDLDFLLTGKSEWTSSSGEKFSITWEFIKYTESLFPFYFYECKMKGFHHTSIGHSAGRDELTAIQRSFAEAWERLWLKHLHESDKSYANILNSNGFAAGKTDLMALQLAREELIERAVLLQAWQQRKGWTPVKIRKLRLKLLTIGLMLKGWKTLIFEIDSNAGKVSTCFILHKKFGAIFDSCFKIENVEEKLLISVAKNSYFQKREMSHLPDVGTPVSWVSHE